MRLAVVAWLRSRCGLVVRQEEGRGREGLVGAREEAAELRSCVTFEKPPKGMSPSRYR